MAKTKAITIKNSLVTSKKSKNQDFIDSKALATQIKKWVKEINEAGIEDNIEAVKKYFSEKNDKLSLNDLSIVTTILKCQYSNEKIVFDSKLLSEKLTFYVIGYTYKTKLVSNDHLYLAMILNQTLDSLETPDPLQNYYKISSVKITSNNFRENSKPHTGFIQDYDGKFSALASERPSDDLIVEILNKKPNRVDFVYQNERYLGFGDENIAFITPYNMDPAVAKGQFNKMKYLSTKRGKIVAGEKKVRNHKDLVYFDKVLKPEDFCPVYWLSPTQVIVNYLFELEVDYNDLFSMLLRENQNKEGLSLPKNLCYWDTLDSCINFLAVFSLTCPGLSNKVKQQLIDIYSEYIPLRAKINKLKNNQLLLQRICQDFLNCFLNDSEYIRFVNLYVKAENYINMQSKVNNQEVIAFLNKLSFIGMIQNQLTDDVMKLGKEIYDVLGDYINGNKPSVIEPNVKRVARKIQGYLPKFDFDKVAFPFISAPGGLLGVDDDNANNMSFGLVEKTLEKRFNKVKKDRRNMLLTNQKIADYVTDIDKHINNYLDYYLSKKLGKTEQKSKDIFISFRKLVRNEMRDSLDLYRYLVDCAIGFREWGGSFVPNGQDLLREVYENFKAQKKGTKSKKQRVLGSSRINRYNLRSRQRKAKSEVQSDAEEEEEEEMDEEDEKEDEKEKEKGKKK